MVVYRSKHADPRFPVGKARLEAVGVILCACLMTLSSFEVIRSSGTAIYSGFFNGTPLPLHLLLILLLLLLRLRLRLLLLAPMPPPLPAARMGQPARVHALSPLVPFPTPGLPARPSARLTTLTAFKA